jgi:hypothetical protein
MDEQKNFRSILDKLATDGLYKPTDEDRGWVKMSKRLSSPENPAPDPAAR